MRKHLPAPISFRRAASVAAGYLILRALAAVAGLAFLFLTVAMAHAGPMDAGDARDPQAASSPCRLSGGGCLNVAGGVGSHLQATFGGDVTRQHGVDSGPGLWEHVYRDSRTILVSFRSADAHVSRCTPDPHGPCPPPTGATRAEFEGTGNVVVGESGAEMDANFQVSVVDMGSCEGTPRDSYSITIRRGLIIGQGEVVHELSGNLECGNLKVEAPWRGKLSGAAQGQMPQSVEQEGRQ